MTGFSVADRVALVQEVSANGLPLSVLAVVTEAGIVRVICHTYPGLEALVEQAMKATAVLADQEHMEFSFYEYRMPHYVGLRAREVNSGVYLWRWRTDVYGDLFDWMDPKHRATVDEPVFLWRPSGWAGEGVGIMRERT